MPKSAYKIVTVRLPDDLIERLKIAAAADGRTVSSYVRKLLAAPVQTSLLPAQPYSPSPSLLDVDPDTIFDE